MFGYGAPDMFTNCCALQAVTCLYPYFSVTCKNMDQSHARGAAAVCSRIIPTAVRCTVHEKGERQLTLTAAPH